MILGLVSILLINLVDTFYISLIGDKELVAISFTFPVTFTIMSFSFGIGIATSAVISRAIGEGNTKKVKRLATDSLSLVCIIVLCISGLSFLYLDFIFYTIGASKESFILIKEYMIPWLLGVIFVVIPIVGNNAIRATGDTKTPSIIMVIMAAVNAVLDPILIFGLGPFPELGIKGASLSTVFSYFIIMIVGIWVLGIREKMLTKSIFKFDEIFHSWKELLHIGFPAMFTQLLLPVSTLILTSFAADLGDKTVAALGVGSRIESVAMIGLIALSSVIIPFIGQNYGAKTFKRIKDANLFSLRFAFIWGTISWIILAFLAEKISWAFTKEIEIQDLINQFLWIVPFGFTFQGISLLISASCNALDHPFHSTSINVMRLFVFILPSAYLGAKIWGSTGLFLGITLGNIATGLIAWFWFKTNILPRVLNN